jgi:cytochrome c556
VAGSASEMDEKEWDNVSQFLRKIYATSEDMKSIAGGFYDPEKKKKAAALIDDVKKLSKAANVPAGSQNGPDFLAYSKKLISSFDEFLDLLQDVPDEL